MLDKSLNRERLKEPVEGSETVYRTKHNGRTVTVKTVLIRQTGDFGKCPSVNKLISACP